MSKPKRDGEQMKIRLQSNLHIWVKDEAKKQERSMNWLINKAVEQLMAAQQSGASA